MSHRLCWTLKKTQGKVTGWLVDWLIGWLLHCLIGVQTTAYTVTRMRFFPMTADVIDGVSRRAENMNSQNLLPQTIRLSEKGDFGRAVFWSAIRRLKAFQMMAFKCWKIPSSLQWYPFLGFFGILFSFEISWWCGLVFCRDFWAHVYISPKTFLGGGAAPKTMGFGGLELDLLRRPPVGLVSVGGGGLGGIPEKAWCSFKTRNLYQMFTFCFAMMGVGAPGFLESWCLIVGRENGWKGGCHSWYFLPNLKGLGILRSTFHQCFMGTSPNATFPQGINSQ